MKIVIFRLNTLFVSKKNILALLFLLNKSTFIKQKVCLSYKCRSEIRCKIQSLLLLNKFVIIHDKLFVIDPIIFYINFLKKKIVTNVYIFIAFFSTFIKLFSLLTSVYKKILYFF